MKSLNETLRSYFVFWAAGVAELEFTSVITVEVQPEAAAGRGHEEAPGSRGESVHIGRERVAHGVEPLRPVSRRVLVVVPDVRQVTGPRVVPHFHLQASATWTCVCDQVEMSGGGPQLVLGSNYANIQQRVKLEANWSTYEHPMTEW